MGGGAVEAKHTHEVVYMYPGRIRLRCAGDRPTVGLMEHKQRLLDVNVALPAASYDLRLTLAVETEQAEEKPVAEGWEARREKLRTSFRDPNVRIFKKNIYVYKYYN